MARATNMLVMLVGCVILAAAAAVSASHECSGVTISKFSFFEHFAEDDILVFGAHKDKNGNTGKGFVYDNMVTKTFKPDSELYGYVGGLYVYPSANKALEIATIYFQDIGEKGGWFAGQEISLRGLWKETASGEDEDTQEFAIVGGVENMAGAYGSVYYTKVGPRTWLVQGEIRIDDSLAQKN